MINEQIGPLFLQCQFDTVYDATSNDFQQFIEREQFRKICEEFMDGIKNLTITYENPFLNMHHYVWTDEQQTKALVIAIDSHQTIQGLYMKPLITYPKSDKKFTKNVYRMPVKDEWYVMWGGVNEFQNYHYPYETQRYAYDLVKLDGDFKSFAANPHLYTSYYAYNEQAVAPCSGTVVKVVNDIADNEIEQTNEQQPAGNYVVIEHAHKEYSLMAHFKQGSIEVKEGEHVYSGQPIGRCGNSGNSSEPHIHFQVMDGPNLERAKSIRIRFVDRTEPVQGTTISEENFVLKEEDDRIFEKGEAAVATAEIFGLIARMFGGFFK